MRHASNGSARHCRTRLIDASHLLLQWNIANDAVYGNIQRTKRNRNAHTWSTSGCMICFIPSSVNNPPASCELSLSPRLCNRQRYMKPRTAFNRLHDFWTADVESPKYDDSSPVNRCLNVTLAISTNTMTDISFALTPRQRGHEWRWIHGYIATQV